MNSSSSEIETDTHHDGAPKRFTRKKKVAAMTAAGLTVAAAAFAYWTTTGSGEGDADTGTTSAVEINQTSTVTDLAPGSGTQALSGDFTNTTNDGPVYVSAVSATISEVNDGSGATLVGCDAGDYTIAGTGAVDSQIPVGTGVGSWGNLTIEFDNDPATNQDACKNAQLVIAYTAT